MLSREDLLELFKSLNNKLEQTENIKKRHILLVGGAVFTLEYKTRELTKDADALSMENELRNLVREVGLEFGMPKDWLNDGAKGFIERTDFSTEIMIEYSRLEILKPDDHFQLGSKDIPSYIRFA